MMQESIQIQEMLVKLHNLEIACNSARGNAQKAGEAKNIRRTLYKLRQKITLHLVELRLKEK